MGSGSEVTSSPRDDTESGSGADAPSLSRGGPPEAALTVGWGLAGATVLLSADVLRLAAGVDPLWTGGAAVAALAGGAAGVSWPSARRVARLAGAAAVYGAAVAVLLWIGLGDVDLPALRTVVGSLAVAAGAVWVALGAIAVPRHWPASRPEWWPTGDPSDGAGVDARATTGRVRDVLRSVLWETGDGPSRRLLFGGAAVVAAGTAAGSVVVDAGSAVDAASAPAGAVAVAVAVVGLGTAAVVVGAVGVGARDALRVGVGAALALLPVGTVLESVAGDLAADGLAPAVVDSAVVGLLAGTAVGCLAVAAACLCVGYPAHWLLRDRSGLRPGVADATVAEAVLPVALLAVPVGVGRATLSGRPGLPYGVLAGATVALFATAFSEEAFAAPLFRWTTVLAVPACAQLLVVPAAFGSELADAVAATLFVGWGVALATTGFGLLLNPE